MKDSAEFGSGHKSPTEKLAESTSNALPSAKGRIERFEPRELHAVRDVVSRYVGQLLYGCGDSGCTEVLCDTGRRNTSNRPVRRYTALSARSVALALASGPKPRQHLCPSSKPERAVGKVEDAEERRDPSSLVQALSDTASVRWLCSPYHGILNGPNPASSRGPTPADDLSAAYKHAHVWLNGISPSPSAGNSAIVENMSRNIANAAGDICAGLHRLISEVPSGSNPMAQWRYVNRIISRGSAYPSSNESIPHNGSHNTWLRILDALDHGPTLETVEYMLSVARDWTRFEIKARELASLSVEESKLPYRTEAAVFHRLAGHVAASQDSQKDWLPLLVFLKKTFLRWWNGEHILEDNLASAALQLMDSMYSCAPKWVEAIADHLNLFSMPIVAARLESVELASSFMQQDKDHCKTGHLLNFRVLFTIHQRASYFRTMNHLRMRKVHSEGLKAADLRRKALLRLDVSESDGELLKYQEEYSNYLLLNVSRGNTLQDAFAQLWQRRKSELRRPLRVRLGEFDDLEIGHDLGGVQIEFFNLVCRELFAEEKGMFTATADPSNGLSYFRPGSLQPLHMFELCGLLFGLALYNGITLPISLPTSFYGILLGCNCQTPIDIRDGWPDVSNTLRGILEGEIPGLEFEYPVEMNGLRLTVNETRCNASLEKAELHVADATRIVHHLDAGETPLPVERQFVNTQKLSLGKEEIEGIAGAWPGWHVVASGLTSPEVNEQNKDRYVLQYLRWLTLGCVIPQWHAFKKGFFSIIDPDTLGMLALNQLKVIMEGYNHFDLEELRKIAEYEGFDPRSKYIQGFWRVVAGWPKEKQRQLYKFVTAAERMPVGGPSAITFKIHRTTLESPEHLPTCSTCFATLQLPRYPTLDVLDKKLSLAIKYGLEGFGTG